MSVARPASWLEPIIQQMDDDGDLFSDESQQSMVALHECLANSGCDPEDPGIYLGIGSFSLMLMLKTDEPLKTFIEVVALGAFRAMTELNERG